MAAGDLVTTDYELEYDGELFGHALGYELIETDLLESPGIRQRDSNRPQDHGQYTGRDYYEGRYFELDMEVWASNEDVFRERLDKLMRVFSVRAQEIPFVIQVPGYGKLRVVCKPRGIQGVTIDKEFDFYVSRPVVRLYCSDPRILSAEEFTASLTLVGQAQTGLEFDIVGDFTFGNAVVTPGSVVVNNTGTFETRPVITINGPITDPGLENLTTGRSLELVGSIAAGQSLVLDFQNRSITQNGQSRYSMLEDPSGWWSLEPGTNVIRLTGTSTGSPTAQVRWRNARI